MIGLANGLGETTEAMGYASTWTNCASSIQGLAAEKERLGAEDRRRPLVDVGYFIILRLNVLSAKAVGSMESVGSHCTSRDVDN